MVDGGWWREMGKGEGRRTEGAGYEGGAEPGAGFVHAPGEGGGGCEVEDGADDGEGDVGDVFPLGVHKLV